MNKLLMSSGLALATGCMAFLLPTNKTNYKIGVENDGGQLVAYKVIGSVGEDQAANAGIRVTSPSLDELRSWQRVIELASYSDTKVCFRWTDYQSVSDTYGDGQTTESMPGDYRTAGMALDTSSGKHYDGPPAAVDETPVTFQYDSYVTEEGVPPRWVPAVANFRRVTVDECFDTDTPLADETSARWTIKSSRMANKWEVSFDFAFGGSNTGSHTAQATGVSRTPPPTPDVRVPPPPPDSFVGRWGGDVDLTLAEGKHTDSGRVHVTLAIVEAEAGMITLAFEGGQVDCPIHATVTDRRATIASGQVCTIEEAKGTLTVKTVATELALSSSGLALSLKLATSKAKPKTKGMITMTGELAAL